MNYISLRRKMTYNARGDPLPRVQAPQHHGVRLDCAEPNLPRRWDSHRRVRKLQADRVGRSPTSWKMANSVRSLLRHHRPRRLHRQRHPGDVMAASVPDIHPHATDSVLLCSSLCSKLFRGGQHLRHLHL